MEKNSVCLVWTSHRCAEIPLTKVLGRAALSSSVWPLLSGQRPAQQAPAWARRQAGARVALSLSAAGCGTSCFQKTWKTRTSSTPPLSPSGPVLDDGDAPWVRGITPPASPQWGGRRRAEHAAGAPRAASAPSSAALEVTLPYTAPTAVRESKAASRDGHLARLNRQEKPGGGAQCPPLPLVSSGLRTAPLYPSCWKTKQRSIYKYLQHTNNTPRSGKVRNSMGEILTVQKSHK